MARGGRIVDSDDDFEFEQEAKPKQSIKFKFSANAYSGGLEDSYVTNTGRSLRERKRANSPQVNNPHHTRNTRNNRLSVDSFVNGQASSAGLSRKPRSSVSSYVNNLSLPQEASDDLGGYGPPDQDAEGEVEDFDNEEVSPADIPPNGTTHNQRNVILLPASDTHQRQQRQAAEPEIVSGSEFDAQDANEEESADDEARAKRLRSESDDDYEERPLKPLKQPHTTRSGRHTSKILPDSDEDSSEPIRSPRKKRPKSSLGGFVLNDDEEDDSAEDYGVSRSKRRQQERLIALSQRVQQQKQMGRTKSSYQRNTRNSRSAILDDDKDASYTAAEDTQEDNAYSFRRRKDVNYAIPTIEQIVQETAAQSNNRRDRAPRKIIRRPKGLPLSMTSKQLDKLFGGSRVADESDDDFATPRKRFGAGSAGMFAGSAGFDAGGTPSNLGRIGGSNLADIDPLLPSNPVTFDSVGGMDDHIQKLKEMVSLPLLYPEVFQRFNVTPPRGVLFHGPPGTGKTLLARALAASCSTSAQKISFFMRKGADCLSKWVGEAERQLRLLFEEAKQSQPSIIFFDEIDGLAPVRSSKQDQIHASIVSTLLALMDGMDGRGQVVVIGATNRPDAVDPALRRPGRFDREFYFPLPNREARRKIIDIHTKGWQPGLSDDFKDELSVLTKGYGGADMRALCTEAALNAVQRRYPQIYKSDHRLLIQPESIEVSARDFVISAKNLIPSTARSTTSLATPLPSHLEPVLGLYLDKAKSLLTRILPNNKKHSVLEDAEYEEDPVSSFQKEKLIQTFERSRIHRPRLLIHGQPGAGQIHVGAAILHHLDGYMVQSLDLSTLVGDSYRSPEATIAQLFVEVKRHKPSVLYIPNLKLWVDSVSDQVKATLSALLETSLDSDDPILLMGLADCPLENLPHHVRSWFGFMKNTRIHIEMPSLTQRRAFFAEIMSMIKLTPAQFPDALPRKRRVLETLAKAPPPPPRKLSEAELRQQTENDLRLREYLKFKLGPVIAELRKRFKRFCRPIGDDYVAPRSPSIPEAETGPTPHEGDAGLAAMRVDEADDVQPATEHVALTSDGTQINGEATMPTLVNGDTSKHSSDQQTVITPTQEQHAPVHRFVNIDLDVINHDLYYDQYLTPAEFLADIQLIVNNASLDSDEEQVSRAGMMLNYASVMTDQACDVQFRAECERMAQRERSRIKVVKDKGKQKQVTIDENTSTVLEQPAKRVRESDGEDERNANKRQRSADGTPIPFKPSLAEDASPANGDSHAEEAVKVVSANQPNSLLTLPMEVDALPAAAIDQEESSAATPEMTILEKHPDFILPQPGTDILTNELETRTHSFNVDQLEQIRAVLSEIIWQHRSEWDRTHMIRNCRDAIANVVQEVAEWQASMSHED